MSDTITQSDVLEVLDTENEKTQEEIALEVFEGEVRCSECGRAYSTFEGAIDEVREVLLRLMDKGYITSTADWKYRRSRRSTDTDN